MSSSQIDAKIINSAMWAAYGDALGFITELTDSSGLEHRTGTRYVENLVDWKRKVGGRFGASIHLPAGCYSDDTQLRLATCRAIRGDGDFDVEVFAKIELPVWLSYSLGAGRGSKAAAYNLVKKEVNWFSNFFKSKGLNYFYGGGNGAAIRVQPHVWMNLSNSDWQSIVRDVIRNTIVTHGHITAIVGSVFHSLVLLESAIIEDVPGPQHWANILKNMTQITEIVEKDIELSTFWLPVWEDENKKAFSEVLFEECSRVSSLINSCSEIKLEGYGSIKEWYKEIVANFGGFDDASRGSGAGTACISAVLAWSLRKSNVKDVLKLAANTLNSDTDSIATMAGAILGLVKEEVPDHLPQDSSYISYEARRLSQIGLGVVEKSFDYPDLGGWVPPRSQIDSLGELNGKTFMSGLGHVKALSAPVSGRGRAYENWQWVDTSFGQKLLVKRRGELKFATIENLPRQFREKKSPPEYVDSQGDFWSKKPSSEPENFLNSEESEDATQIYNASSDDVKNNNIYNKKDRKSIDLLTTEAIKTGFQKDIIGEHLLYLIDEKKSVEEVIAYAAIIAKAKISRNNKK